MIIMIIMSHATPLRNFSATQSKRTGAEVATGAEVPDLVKPRQYSQAQGT